MPDDSASGYPESTIPVGWHPPVIGPVTDTKIGLGACGGNALPGRRAWVFAVLTEPEAVRCWGGEVETLQGAISSCYGAAAGIPPAGRLRGGRLTNGEVGTTRSLNGPRSVEPPGAAEGFGRKVAGMGVA